MDRSPRGREAVTVTINDKVGVDCTKRSAAEALDERIFAGVPDFVC
jgi:hypothetical protein